MRNLGSRLGQMERKVGERPCPAAGRLPRCVLVEGEGEHEVLCRRMEELEELCTCGRGHRVKLVVLDESADVRALH